MKSIQLLRERKDLCTRIERSHGVTTVTTSYLETWLDKGTAGHPGDRIEAINYLWSAWLFSFYDMRSSEPSGVRVCRSRHRSLTRAIIVSIGAVLVTGCQQGYQTIVVNNSQLPYVVHAQGVDASRYYAVRPGDTVVVDDVGHVNPAADTIVLLDRDCQQVADVGGHYWKGGVITMDADGVSSFEAERPLPMVPRILAGADEQAVAVDTCESAAARL